MNMRENHMLIGNAEHASEAPFLRNALDEVVEVVMLFGEYPQPKPGRTPLFRLKDWLQDCYSEELADIALSFLVDNELDAFTLKIKHEKVIEKKVREYLREEDFVADLAQEMEAEHV